MGLKNFIFNNFSKVMATNGSIGIKNGQVEIWQIGQPRVTLPLHDVTVSRSWRSGTLIIRTKGGKTYKLHFWNGDDARTAYENINYWGRWFY